MEEEIVEVCEAEETDSIVVISEEEVVGAHLGENLVLIVYLINL